MKSTTREAVKAFIVSKIRDVTCEDLIWLKDTYGLEENDFEIAEYFDAVASRVKRYLQYLEFPPTLLERGMNGDAEAARKLEGMLRPPESWNDK